MSGLYTALGIVGSLIGLLWYLKRTIVKLDEVKAENSILKETERYNDEVIKELSKRPTMSDVTDSLHKGDF